MKAAALDNSLTVSDQTEMLKEFLTEERSSSDRAIEKAVKLGSGWGFGPFAGVGYSGDGFNATIGIGLVYKF